MGLKTIDQVIHLPHHESTNEKIFLFEKAANYAERLEQIGLVYYRGFK